MLPPKYIRHQLRNELSEYLKNNKMILIGREKEFGGFVLGILFVSLFYSKERTQKKKLKVELKFYPLFHSRNFMLFV